MSSRGPQLREVIVAALARLTDRDVGTIDDDTVLDALGFDSLLFTGLLLEVEDALGVQYAPEALVRIEETELVDVRRVGDLTRALAAALEPSP